MIFSRLIQGVQFYNQDRVPVLIQKVVEREFPHITKEEMTWKYKNWGAVAQPQWGFIRWGTYAVVILSLCWSLHLRESEGRYAHEAHDIWSSGCLSLRGEFSCRHSYPGQSIPLSVALLIVLVSLSVRPFSGKTKRADSWGKKYRLLPERFDTRIIERLKLIERIRDLFFQQVVIGSQFDIATREGRDVYN